MVQLSRLQEKLQALWEKLEQEPANESFEKIISSCDADDLVLTDETFQRGNALLEKVSSLFLKGAPIFSLISISPLLPPQFFFSLCHESMAA